MTEQLIDTAIEYPELINTNGLRLHGTLDDLGVVTIEVITPMGTFSIYRTIAQTRAFLNACDLQSELIVSVPNFGEFFVL